MTASSREGDTGIPACASDPIDPQTGISVLQLEREIDPLVYALYLPVPTRMLRRSQRGQGLWQAGGLMSEEIKLAEEYTR